MEKLLPYVERELAMLRLGGAEFAERYPKLAGNLQVRADACADPHVERLIQASALLNARVAKLLDDGQAGFTEALLGMLYPHTLRPTPSCSIARIDHGGGGQGAGQGVAGQGAVGAAVTLPRGTPMTALGQAGTAASACRFRSVYDAVVAPVAIRAVWFEPYIEAPARVRMPAEAGAAICITLEMAGIVGVVGGSDDAAGGFRSVDIGGAAAADVSRGAAAGRARGLASLGLSRLRVFIDGEPSLRAALRDTLFMHATCACVEADGQWERLDKAPISTVGFAEDDALLPAAPSEHAVYRLLSEYFAFPEKFDFFDIDLRAVLAAAPAGCARLTLRLALSGFRPDMPAAQILRALGADNLALGCTPVVNLFAQQATPIRITHALSSYPLMPDQSPGSEIYSIDAVYLVRKLPDGEHVDEFFPYYSLRHGGEACRKGRYWLANRDQTLASGAAVHDFSLTLVDHDFSPFQIEEATASVRVTCTNRDAPHYMEYGRGRGDLGVDGALGRFPIRLLRRPTLSHRPGAGGESQPALLSHLALNHRSLTQEGLPALAAMLRLYARPGDAVSQRQIDGVTGVSSRPAACWLRQARGSAYLRGIDVTVTLDEEAYAGSGLHLFAQLLDHLFGLHVHLNSYTRLLIVSAANGKELLRCPPRNGMMSLA